MTAPFRPARPVAAASLAVALALGSPAATAHPAPPHEEVEQRIAELSAALRDDPEDATLYLARAEMLRHHERWEEAFADLERAAELDPDLPGLTLASSRVAGDAGHRTLALELVERQLAETPDSPGALRQRARLLGELRRWDEAVPAWNRAFANDPAPHPEDFVARMEATLAASADGVAAVDDGVDPSRAEALRRARLAMALHGLDEGIALLGDVVTLQLEAVELERELGRHDAALARIDRLAAQAARIDPWLERRGDLLAHAGRAEEARDAWRAALDALQSLPRSHRETPASKQRRERLTGKLAPPTDTTARPDRDPEPPR